MTATGDWTPAFPGQRPPFEPGNQIARGNRGPMKHGVYSLLRLSKRAREIADDVWGQLPAASRSDTVTVELLAIALARVEAADRALAEVDERAEDTPLSPYAGSRASQETLARVRQDLRGWENTAGRLAERLGLSLGSRSSIGLDVAQIQAVQSRQVLDLKRLSEGQLRQLREIMAAGDADAEIGAAEVEE